MFENEYATYDEIPSEVRHLFIKSGDKYVLISAGQIKTQDDVAAVQEGLRKEREDHQETKAKLRKFRDLDPTEVFQKLDRIDELEAAAGDKIDEEKINQMVESRIRTRTAPLERQVADLQTQVTERDSVILEYKGKDRQRTIHDHIRKAATGAKILDTAVEDALIIGERIFDVDENNRVIAKENVGVTPGIDPVTWLTEVKQTRPHWWPVSQGAGAKGGQGGGGGTNPWAKDSWSMTEQGKLYRENPELAEQMAKSAGTTIGGPKPQ